MKKIFFLPLILFAFVFASAQSFDEANEKLYYERYHSAETIFHKMLKQDPANARAWYGLTRSYVEQDDLSMAADSLMVAPVTIHSDPYYKVARGMILLQQNKSTEANALFNDALEQTKYKDESVLAAVASAHIQARNGNGNYAVELLNKAIKRAKNDPALYVLLGNAYRKLVNGTESYKAYTKAIEKNKNYAAAYHRIGEIFKTQNNPAIYLDYFKKAINADTAYGPALYSLYLYEFYHNPAQASNYYQRYLANTDVSIQNEYDMADLLFLNKQFTTTIQKAEKIVQIEGDKAHPRLYKMIGYSYAENKDTTNAIEYMERYFEIAHDTMKIARDYVTLGEFYAAGENDSLASIFLAKAVTLEKDTTALYKYYKKLSQLAAAKKDYPAQAKWLEAYYTGNENATNVDLFNWAIAHYRSDNFVMADSVFGIYIQKYPEQSFGYYWQAKSKALRDPEMKEGLAVPAYQKLIEVLGQDTTDVNYTKWMIEAYGYLAAYEANTNNDYATAVEYFEKVLEFDPVNEDAKKYIGILEKGLADKASN